MSKAQKVKKKMKIIMIHMYSNEIMHAFLIFFVLILMVAGCGTDKVKPLKPFDLSSGWCYNIKNSKTDRCIDLLEKERNNYYQ